MDPSAKSLFLDHSRVESRLQIVKTKIQRVHTLEERRHVGAAERMAALRDPVKSNERASQCDPEALRRELQDLEYQHSLYHAVLKALSEAEVRLIQLHYQDGLPFSQIAEMNLLADRPSTYSVSTLKRMHTSALNKASSVLRESA